MLRNNADARRYSYFELGLPVVFHTQKLLYIDITLKTRLMIMIMVLLLIGKDLED